MSQTSIKNEPKVAQDSENQKPPPPLPNESFEKPTPSQKRKSESLLDNSDSMETSQTNISPGSNGSSSNLATGREKRIRKAKAYDDDFLMYDIPSCSNSTLFQSLAKQMQPAAQEQQAVEVKFNLGDLVWAKVSGHPWWPCIISNPDLSTLNSLKNYNEPKNENSHFKLIGGSRPKRSYYVEFFGPSIEHAWVPEGNILEYKGIDAFKSFSQQQIDQANTRHAKERQTEKYALKITLPKREHWDQAISEADGLMNKKPRDRKLYFIKKHTNEDQEVKSEPVADEEEDQAVEGVKVTKVKRESIESNADSVQNEGKKSKKSKKQENIQNENSKVVKKKDQKRKISSELGSNPQLDIPALPAKKPLQDKNNISNTVSNTSTQINKPEISDEKLLQFIKNRLTALTLLNNNILKIDSIANKYEVDRRTIFHDFFGFNLTDQDSTSSNEDKANFVAKLEAIRTELENKLKYIGESLRDMGVNLSDKKVMYSKVVPRALISIKYRVPMIFVNIIYNYMYFYPKQVVDDFCKENSSFPSDLIENLYTFKNVLFENRCDLNKINDLVNEKCKHGEFGQIKCIQSIKHELINNDETEHNSPVTKATPTEPETHNTNV